MYSQLETKPSPASYPTYSGTHAIQAYSSNGGIHAVFGYTYVTTKAKAHNTKD